MRPTWIELADPAPAGIRDDGPGLLDKIQADLQMDEEWIVREPRSLTWWGEPLPLRFAVAEPRITHGDPTVKLTAAVTVLTEVTADPAEVLARLDEMNRFASTGAFVWLQDERRIDAFLTQYHHDGVEAITHVVSAFALLLYGEAVGRARVLAVKLGGTPNVLPHPESGARDDYDEMMTFTESQVLPAGEQANRWVGGPLEHLARYLTENSIGISTGGEDGLTVEFPLAGNDVEKYVRLRSHLSMGGEFGDDPMAPFFSMPAALEQLMCVDHPLYQAGLLSLLRFPVRTRGDAAAFANDVNLGEYRGLTGIPAIGAWCSDDAGIAQTSFVPNLLYADWVAPNLALWSASRARWAFEAVAPDRIERPG